MKTPEFIVTSVSRSPEFSNNKNHSSQRLMLLLVKTWVCRLLIFVNTPEFIVTNVACKSRWEKDLIVYWFTSRSLCLVLNVTSEFSWTPEESLNSGPLFLNLSLQVAMADGNDPLTKTTPHFGDSFCLIYGSLKRGVPVTICHGPVWLPDSFIAPMKFVVLTREENHCKCVNDVPCSIRLAGKKWMFFIFSCALS